MKSPKYRSKRKPSEYERALIEWWKKNETFERSISQRPSKKQYVFYDGPPFLTGTPHHGHLLISALKDAVARYWTMNGYRVERTWGWDCHGLPAEVFVESKLGIKNKKEIGEKISVADYVRECRAAMVKTGTEWEDTIERIGRWTDFDDAYKTMDKEFMESVWWAFQRLYDQGKIYEGEKVLVYCTKDATPISKFEVAMESSYQEVTDPSVYVYFELEESDEYLLAWTTTPWTLPANVAIAVNPKMDYSLIDYDNKRFYIATEAVERVMKDEKNTTLNYSVVKKVKGATLVNRTYAPLFQHRGPDAHKVLAADFVEAESGTGIVHEAPAYGEEDYELCHSAGVPIVSIIDENGHFTEGPWQGELIWDASKAIAKSLLAEGRALKIDYIRHDYPHCHRCGNKLMYRAHPSWFLDIQGQKKSMLEANEKANWVPDHLRTGRFKHMLETAPDWNLSRDRYWATPIPVWRGVRNDGSVVTKVIGSYDEFEKLTGKRLSDYHLPNVMDVTFELDGVELHHIGKVLDCWFESGSMPFAQFHYPFENKAVFEQRFPADFITEAIDQTRGWFYSLTAVNIALFEELPFKNVITTGHINAADGKKLSKKLKNYTDPMDLMDKYSADAFRFLMLSSPLTNGEGYSLSDKAVAEATRKLSMIWNMYDFFTMYANVDDWEWDGSMDDPSDRLSNELDVWIVSRLHQLTKEMTAAMNKYEIAQAIRPVLPFLDDASNWYIRRSRKRFWKTEDDADKNNAYTTLHYVLVSLAQLMAPFTPFLADELYMNLVGGGDSVHLKDWPAPGKINAQLVAQMNEAREIVKNGLSIRAQEQIKVRQPLASVTVALDDDFLTKTIQDMIIEELNVKNISFSKSQKEQVALDLHVTEELEIEGIAREIVRHIQSYRKEAGLNVDDRIILAVESQDSKIKLSIKQHNSYIKNETLALEIRSKTDMNNKKVVNITSKEVILQIEKATKSKN